MNRKVVLLFVVLSILAILGCDEEKVQPRVDTSLDSREMPSQESWNSVIHFTDSGRTTAILHVGHVCMFTEAQETLIDSGLQVDFYNKQEIHTTTLTSDSGRVDDKTKDLYAFGNVFVVGEDNMTLETEKLQWRNKDKKIVSDQFVTITTPQEQIKGYGFESDQTLDNYVIHRITLVTEGDSL